MGGRHFSQTVIQNVYAKVNPEAQRPNKVISGSCSFSGPNKSQVFTKKMNKQTKTKFIKGEKNLESANCKNNHSSAVSEQSLCDLNSKGDTLKLHDMCLICRSQR